MLIVEMVYSKCVYELQLKNLVERTKECHFYHEMYKIKMQLTKLVAQETVRKKKKKLEGYMRIGEAESQTHKGSRRSG